MPVPCQTIPVLTGILIGVVGVVAVLGTGCAAAVRQTGSPAAWIDSRPWLHADRLRLARTQLTESVGPIGAFLFLLGGGVLVVSAVAAVFGFGLAAIEHPVDWWAFHLSD